MHCETFAMVPSSIFGPIWRSPNTGLFKFTKVIITDVGSQPLRETGPRLRNDGKAV